MLITRIFIGLQKNDGISNAKKEIHEQYELFPPPKHYKKDDLTADGTEKYIGSTLSNTFSKEHREILNESLEHFTNLNVILPQEAC